MAKTPTIACIGGGTGLFTTLSGLKEEFPKTHIRAIVSMMDSGGSTGRLRDEFGYLPPGDVRRCLVALSNAPEYLRKLMEYRFNHGEGLQGHTLGNLMLTALKESLPGNAQEREYAAIEAMESILNIHGKVYPVTLTNCHLCVTLSDGTSVKGEHEIDIPKHDPSLSIQSIWLEPAAKIFAKTKEAIESADAIIIGPGDLYTSIMPNLLVDGVAQALAKAQRRGAKIIYVVNTMTKHGETTGYSARRFVEVIEKAIGKAHLDAVIVNTGKISTRQRTAYAKEHAIPVENDLTNGYVLIAEDLVEREMFARHDGNKLARAIVRALEAR